ncbi:MAG TPA: DUF58 domain-containing protein [Bacillus sp. (in: firmicutes)]|uniref:DUF58 domain-containing protein n=1 Tax=Bacillus litorisediminis TaxID=2922713 RepID=UPI001FAEE6E0|nr:DUF58 domain-containing protein [Bacillus litorisediminis]HWO76499.1 DUF58 domain-containing protein [Bacillus sp. (in: firmicutes)]
MEAIIQPHTVSRLKKLKWQSPQKLKSMHTGARKSSQIGQSQEFSDYRTYEAGDDVRQIDWNVYARTEKLYIKRFLEERELTLTIILDQSKSMSVFENKWLKAKQIAGAISALSLHAGDRVSVQLDTEQSKAMFLKKGSFHVPRFLMELQTLAPVQDSLLFSEHLQAMVIPQTDVTIVITDGLEQPEEIEKSLKRLQLGRSQLYYMQVLDPEELAPDYTGDWKLVDIEDHSVVEVSMQNRVLKEYEHRLHEHLKSIQLICQRKGIHYTLISANSSIEEIIFQQLKQTGWIY